MTDCITDLCLLPHFLLRCLCLYLYPSLSPPGPARVQDPSPNRLAIRSHGPLLQCPSLCVEGRHEGSHPQGWGSVCRGRGRLWMDVLEKFGRNFFLWINTDTIKEVYFLSADWIIKKFHNILTFDVQLKKKTNALKHFFK